MCLIISHSYLFDHGLPIPPKICPLAEKSFGIYRRDLDRLKTPFASIACFQDSNPVERGRKQGILDFRDEAERYKAAKAIS